jgi:hypothetical protein
MPYKNKSDKIENDRTYYATNKEKVRARQRIYYLRKREAILARKRGFRAGVKASIKLVEGMITLFPKERATLKKLIG